MITVGIDLAARPAGTALCVLRWLPGGARLESVRVGMHDDELLASAASADKVGVDAPLGWPRELGAFLHAVEHHQGAGVLPFAGPEGLDRLSFRTTDYRVRQEVGRWPLSVSTDRIGRVAMRAAVLHARWEMLLGPQPRDGSASIAEVYPASAVRRWKLASGSYKSRAASVEHLKAAVDGLLEAAPWLDLEIEDVALLSTNDDAFDALLCALVARAAALGGTLPPTQDEASAALAEGWIHLPTLELGQLPSRVPTS